jgi:hypothetical protein
MISIYRPNIPYNASNKQIRKDLKIIMTKLKKQRIRCMFNNFREIVYVSPDDGQ